MNAPATTDEDGLVGVDPDEADLTVSEEKREEGLDYISKSRIKTFKQCPRKFWFKYWTENRPPGNFYTERGTQVHEVFETFHQNVMHHFGDGGGIPEQLSAFMPGDFTLWSQWLDPYVGNFFKFEDRRQAAVHEHITEKHGPPRSDRDARAARAMHKDLWQPVAVEAEAWLGDPPDPGDAGALTWVEPDGPPVGDIPWQGKADAILNTESLPGVEGTGVTILDYKTGSVPDRQYRDEGIFLEGEYYGRLFEPFFDVDAVAGYYPKADKLITSPYPNQERWWDIKAAAKAIQEPPEKEDFPAEEQPLCHYGSGKCFFYDECESEWAE